MDDEQRRDEGLESRRNRLPSFTEVLSRRTRPPVDLFMFYLFLQREGAEDVLDFWLDVQQHENLCRAYFKDVRKSGRTVREDWPEYWDYARRRGSIYGTVVGMNPHMGTKRSTASTADLMSDQDRHNLATVDNEKAGRSPSPRIVSTSPGTHTAVASEPPRSTTPFSLSGRTPTLFNMRRASRAPTIIPRSAAINRQDLIASAERIYFRYLSPAGRNHEPKSANEMSLMAQIPDMFHAQKEYCFRAMEQDAFPRFLRAKAFGNLTPVSALVRLIVGLIVLWVGLAVGFSLIFLDVTPKSKRFFLFLPYAVAILFLVSHQYELDPILVFLGQSESTPFRTLRIREPYVKKLLVGRALWVSTLVAACTVALTMIFWAVPGHRL
ncbi:RGS domain-containing protein [Fomitopsis serialis]|uniref:RGS domain-containing protein n=1 Tax=Fomitopsis serialis TaxID=139415 RepID=UPI002007209F|nr:RGS domain-containing protein [Neoantrodia serialis]KAH9918060.1 RGS domain-containing protein [Neoantrodia serialis]